MNFFLNINISHYNLFSESYVFHKSLPRSPPWLSTHVISDVHLGYSDFCVLSEWFSKDTEWQLTIHVRLKGYSTYIVIVIVIVIVNTTNYGVCHRWWRVTFRMLHTNVNCQRNI